MAVSGAVERKRLNRKENVTTAVISLSTWLKAFDRLCHGYVKILKVDSLEDDPLIPSFVFSPVTR